MTSVIPAISSVLEILGAYDLLGLLAIVLPEQLKDCIGAAPRAARTWPASGSDSDPVLAAWSAAGFEDT